MAIQRNEALHQRIQSLTEPEFLEIINDNEKLAELGIHYVSDLKKGEQTPTVNRTINVIRATLDSIPPNAAGVRPITELIRQYKQQLFMIAQGRNIIIDDSTTKLQAQSESNQGRSNNGRALDFLLEQHPLGRKIAVTEDLSELKARAYILKMIESINSKGVPLANRDNLAILPLLQGLDVYIQNIETDSISPEKKYTTLSEILEKIIVASDVFSQENKSSFVNTLFKIELANVIASKLYPHVRKDRDAQGVVLAFLNRIYGPTKTYINTRLRYLNEVEIEKTNEENHELKKSRLDKASRKLEQLIQTLKRYADDIDSPARRLVDTISQQSPSKEDKLSFYEKNKKNIHLIWDIVIVLTIIIEVFASAYYFTPLAQMMYDLDPQFWESLRDQFLKDDASVDTIVAVMTAPRLARLSMKIEELCIPNETI